MRLTSRIQIKLLPALLVILIIAGYTTTTPKAEEVATPNGHWLAEADYDRLNMVVAENPTPSEQYAANEFAHWWEASTGFVPTQSGQTQAGKVNVWIGRAIAPEHLLRGLDLEGLGTDGIYLKTVLAEDSGTGEPGLILAGGEPRGVKYAALEFIEKGLGIRWLTPEVTHIPEAPASIDPMETYYVPQILRRVTSYHQGWGEKRGEFVEKMRLSWEPDFGPGAFVHTIWGYLPPEEYFEAHPEWYPLLDGKRVAPTTDKWREKDWQTGHRHLMTQLCFSNPEVAEKITEILRQRMRENPEREIWSVSQQDWGGYCECEDCTAIVEREGTLAGPLLVMVNRIAEALEDEFPHNYVETLAYTYTRKAPRHIKPRKNVLISLCDIEVNFAVGLDNAEWQDNREFMKDMSDWSAIAENLFYWDYPANCFADQVPHPNFHYLDRNMQLLAENGAMGLYLCGGMHPEEELGQLRAYLLSKLMWNPNGNYEQWKNEFIDLFYLEAAPYVKDYIKWQRQYVVDHSIDIDPDNQGWWVTTEFVEGGEAIFSRALAEPSLSGKAEHRLRQLKNSLDFCGLLAQPQVDVRDGRMVYRRPKGSKLEQVIADREALKMPRRDGEAHDQYTIRKTRSIHHVDYLASDIIELENEHALMWIVPGIHGSVARWQDKVTGRELLGPPDESYQTPIQPWHFWQEWVMGPPVPPEYPVAASYEVLERGSDWIRMGATLENGLRLERELKLHEESGGVEMMLTLVNPTSEPVVPKVKIHPEFRTFGEYRPQLWTLSEAGWQFIPRTYESGLGGYGHAVEPGGLEAWAVWLPEQGVGIKNTFEADQVGLLYFYYNVHHHLRHVNLELFTPNTALAPGQSLRIDARYEVIAAAPTEKSVEIAG